MNRMTWDAIAKQLRSIGVDVPVIQPGADLCKAGIPAETPPPSRQTAPIAAATPLQRSGFETDRENADPDVLARVLGNAAAAGVSFFQNVMSGELVIDQP